MFLLQDERSVCLQWQGWNRGDDEKNEHECDGLEDLEEEAQYHDRAGMI